MDVFFSLKCVFCILQSLKLVALGLKSHSMHSYKLSTLKALKQHFLQLKTFGIVSNKPFNNQALQLSF